MCQMTRNEMEGEKNCKKIETGKETVVAHSNLISRYFPRRNESNKKHFRWWNAVTRPTMGLGASRMQFQSAAITSAFCARTPDTLRNAHA